MTSHALERARLRLGVQADKALTWINDLMKKAKYISAQGDHRLIYENGDVRIIVDTRNNMVVTVHHALRMDFLKPSLEREIRKLKREYTKSIRTSERHLSNHYRKLGEQMKNYANARNPQTRELIGNRIEETKSAIDGITGSIERKKDELQAKIKAIEVIME